MLIFQPEELTKSKHTLSITFSSPRPVCECMPGQCPGPARGLAPGIVQSRGHSVGSVPLAGSCYMVTVIFVVCLGIVFTALQRINNCHKKTASPGVLFEQDSEVGVCRLGVCVYVYVHVQACFFDSIMVLACENE